MGRHRWVGGGGGVSPLDGRVLPVVASSVAAPRDGPVVIPQPETVRAAGDELVAIATPEAEDDLRRALE